MLSSKSISMFTSSQAALNKIPAQSGAAATTSVTDPVVDVMFPLIDDEEWPPYPAEMIDSVLIAHDLAEIRGLPRFVTNISRGDIVKVRHDGIGYVGGPVISRGGHSTVHVLAASEDELVPIVERLGALGVVVATGQVPPMLTVDVPESCSLEPVLAVLSAAESATCAYAVVCRQHRGAQDRSVERRAD